MGIRIVYTMFSQCQPLKRTNKHTKQTKTQINLIIYINSHKFLSNLVKLHQTNRIYVKPMNQEQHQNITPQTEVVRFNHIIVLD